MHRPLLAALLLGALLMAGCGQKGPLYLPGDEQAAERYGPVDTQRDDNHADEDAD